MQSDWFGDDFAGFLSHGGSPSQTPVVSLRSLDHPLIHDDWDGDVCTPGRFSSPSTEELKARFQEAQAPGLRGWAQGHHRPSMTEIHLRKKHKVSSEDG